MQKSSCILIKSAKCCYFQNRFQESIAFSVSIENHPCYPNKEKACKLFVYSCNIFPVIDPNEHINNIYHNYNSNNIMLDSALDPSYNDSTP